MKIAVPVTRNKQVDGHFGHCEFYCVYTISEANEIVKSEVMDSPQGCGCKSNIAPVLAQAGVKIMLAGGIGEGAINVLNQNGIEVVRGCAGGADELVQQFISGLVKDSGETCKHHHGDDGHSCNH
ncbi:NifB/NifX family molybdenum-iron cluster-binding protein [Marinifilum sp.]|uniref:NifB/NifX family molybdenum-iron cluster-binding protein n=1 Tax=Marinifilum sp. TaxID=2033137 RepID=UPI003BAC57C1